MIDPESESDATWSGNGRNPVNRVTEGFEEFLPERVREFVDPSHMRALIRSHPLSVTFGALALGFIVARAMRKD